ncbi:MAG: DUF2865 domain-containing protein [Pseudomonadota bacterium]
MLIQIFQRHLNFDCKRDARTPRAAVAFVLMAGLAVSSTVVDPANAQSRVCKQLHTQLASLKSGKVRRARSKLKKYTRALNAQEKQITRARELMKRKRCGSLFAGLTQGSVCSGLRQNLQKMTANRTRLTARKAKYSAESKGTAGSSRKSILRRMKKNNCVSQRSASRNKKRVPRGTSITEQIFGPNNERNREFRGTNYAVPAGVRATGSYRTMCVRMCDGYYFPISHATGSQNFARDAEACASMCPGTSTDLFVHPAKTEDTDNMMSVSSEIAYSNLGTAYLYRERVVPSCTCQSTQSVNFSTIAGGTDGERNAQAEVDFLLAVSKPQPRPDPITDPESRSNSGGKFVVDYFRSIRFKGEKIAARKTVRKIRIVGQGPAPAQ